MGRGGGGQSGDPSASGLLPQQLRPPRWVPGAQRAALPVNEGPLLPAALRAVSRAFVKCTQAARLKRHTGTPWVNRVTAASRDRGLTYPAPSVLGKGFSP
uniref:Uncharacterized protein n=1 Tax=Ailuropoda melanoleuca TaxID=9646 RepID=A0A7N5P445_AILME